MPTAKSSHLPVQSSTSKKPGDGSENSSHSSCTAGVSSNRFYNDLVQVIAGFFRVPMAAISFVDEKLVQVKAGVGFDDLQMIGRDKSLWEMSLKQKEPLVIKIAKEHPLLASHPFTKGDEGVRLFASTPLITEAGSAIGFVCIADRTDRAFSEVDRAHLSNFATMVMHEIALKAEVIRSTGIVMEKEIQLQQAFAMAKVGVWEYDVLTQKTTWSDELYSVYGVSKTSCNADLFDLYFSMLHPDDLESITAEALELENLPASSTHRLVRPDGSLLYLRQVRRKIYDEEGKLVKVVGISQDVSEQTEYGIKLQISEDRFKALVQNSSDMVAVLDADGTIRYMSPASLPLSGFSPEELVGRNVFEFMHQDDIPLLTTELQKVSQYTNSGDPTLHRFRTKKGGWIWLESKGMNLSDNAAIGGIVINARNVTERKQLEEKLSVEQRDRQRVVTSAVIKAQEEERSQLGRELHDNVNQVLTTVKLYTEMIQEGIGDQKELIRKSGQHLQSCIDEIRSISKRLAAPTLGEISLEDSIRELAESLNMTNRIEIIYNSAGLANMQIQQDIHLAIYRIIQEQLNNILKYAGASVVKITLSKKDDQLVLSIKDDGKGFDVGAKRTGIGITNMRTRAENLNGQFTLASEPGKGCLLQVRFLLQQT